MRTALHRRLVSWGCLILAATVSVPVRAELPEPLRGPALSAASNFSQGRSRNMLEGAEALGVRNLRDGLSWERSETAPGVYSFSDPLLRFPAELEASGIDLSVVLNWGNRLYDGGDTPHGEAAVAAFGNFAGAVLRKFPRVTSLEIGNEFNGVNFVRGPLKEMTPRERARAYVPLLKAASEAARDVRPDIRILGGATHSMAVGYLWEVLDAGGGAFMDALAIHPYTTPAEQLVRQVAVLRRHPVAARMPIEVTEFGEPKAERAGDHFLRNYCQMALAGVTRTVWFPLNARGKGLVSLFRRDGDVTPAGQAYQLIAARMEGREVTDAASDPFTFGCRFGENVLVLWGYPRSVSVRHGVEVLDAQGQPMAVPYRLSEEAPIVLVREDGAVADAVEFGATNIVADSFYQFGYPEGMEARASGDAFERFARRDGIAVPLETLPGQERSGVPWYPYRGNASVQNVRLSADTLLPGGRGDRPVEIVHRFIAPSDMTVDVDARFTPDERSEDGIAVQMLRGGEPVFETNGRDPIRLKKDALRLRRGETLEFVVGPNGTPRRDATDYRIRLLRSGS